MARGAQAWGVDDRWLGGHRPGGLMFHHQLLIRRLHLIFKIYSSHAFTLSMVLWPLVLSQVRLLLLAAVSGEHILLIGPPGTAKSEVGRRLNKLIAGTAYFERLLTRFSVPEVRRCKAG